MVQRITVTEVARHFRDVLNAIEERGETFRIERHGRAVAELRPVASVGRRFTGQELAELLRRLPAPDPEFAADLAQVRAEWRAAPLRDPWDGWASSSTAPS